MKYFLVVYLMTANGWYMGDAMDGYSPREQPSMEACLSRKETGQASEKPKGILQWVWICAEVTPKL